MNPTTTQARSIQAPCAGTGIGMVKRVAGRGLQPAFAGGILAR